MPCMQVMLQRHNMLQRQVLMLRAACEPLTAEDRSRLEARPACCIPLTALHRVEIQRVWFKGTRKNSILPQPLLALCPCKRSALHIALLRYV